MSLPGKFAFLVYEPMMGMRTFIGVVFVWHNIHTLIIYEVYFRAHLMVFEHIYRVGYYRTIGSDTCYDVYGACGIRIHNVLALPDILLLQENLVPVNTHVRVDVCA